MKKNTFFIFFFSVSFPLQNLLYSQTDSLLNIINDLADEGTIYTELFSELSEQPLNINLADKDDLLNLPLITSPIADSIISHRLQYGHYRSKRQIRKIMGTELYDLLKPYLTASNKKTIRGRVTHRNTYSEDNKEGKYQGNPVNSYSKIIYNYNRFLKAGFVLQKDAGERNYADHFNFSLQYKKNKWNVLLGNYYVQFSEGLTHSNFFGNRKSTQPQTSFSDHPAFARQNLSSSESSGKFGIFLQHNFEWGLSIFSFYSKAKRDVLYSDAVITGLKFDGLHRTGHELHSKWKLTENNWGAGFRQTFSPCFSVSAIINSYSFSDSIINSEETIGESQKRRRFFAFSGNKLFQGSISYHLTLNQLKLTSEISASDKGAPGWIQSVLYSTQKFSIGFKYWHIAKDFMTIDGRSFDNAAPFPNGIKGFYIGSAFKFSKKSILSALRKSEYRTWRSYFYPMPTSKNEWLTQWNLTAGRIHFLLRLRNRISEEYQKTETGSVLYKKEQNIYRIQIQYHSQLNLSTTSRWEHTKIKKPLGRGTLFFQEVNYILFSKLNLSSRFTLFNTSSFDARLYEYERGVPGTFSNTALFGNGHKFYTMLKWELFKGMRIWIKWRYILKQTTSESGRFYKNINRDINFQVQYNF